MGDFLSDGKCNLPLLYCIRKEAICLTDTKYFDCLRIKCFNGISIFGFFHQKFQRNELFPDSLSC